jgi:hypothetical protein
LRAKIGVKPHKRKFVAGSVLAGSSRRMMMIAGSFFGGGQGQLTHPEIIDDEERHRSQEPMFSLRVHSGSLERVH